MARGIVAVLLALAAFVLPVPADVAIATLATQASADLRFEGHTRYDVDVAAGMIRVVQDSTVTNNAGDQGNVQFFYPELTVAVLPEATNLAATRSDGQPLAVELERDDAVFSRAIVDLVPDLAFGETVRVRLTYDLPDLGPRADGFTRVTPAIATFAAFGYGDSGIASFEVRAPLDLEVESAGVDLERSVEGDVQVFTSGAIDDPARSLTIVSARNDAALLSRELTVDDRDIVIQAWPDDPEWSAFAEQTLRSATPALERLIGLEWPIDEPLTVSESASPYVYGYAGWFRPSENTIELGDALDAQVILHEMSHLWFNDALFAERWINEGFADTFASLARTELGEAAGARPPVSAEDAGAFALATWGAPEVTEGIGDEATAARENFGYAASQTVVQQIADEVGIDGLRAVIASAAADEIAYRGDVEAEVEAAAGVTDSRQLLDRFEEAGSTIATGTFSRFVLAPEDVALLPRRTEARAAYAQLVAMGAGWSAPYPVREAMAQWEFDAAATQIAEAEPILAVRDELATALEPLDLDIPIAFEQEYESTDDLDTAAALGRDLADASIAIAAATEKVDDSRTAFETIGLLGSDPDGAVADARREFAAGDANGARIGAQDAEEAIDGSASAGAQRLAIALGVAVLVALAIVLLVRRRRRSSSEPVPAAESWTPPQ